MREYEIHASVSYVAGGTRYYNCYHEYITASSKAEARKILKAQYASEGIRLEYADILEA